MSSKTKCREKKKSTKAPKGKQRKTEVVADTESIASMTSGSSDDACDVDSTSSTFADLVELLSEKRSSTRIEALQSLINTLNSSLREDELTSRLDTLQLYLSNIIRRNGSMEVKLACRAASLVMITLGTESEAFIRDLLPGVLTLAKNRSKPATSREACLTTYATAHFIVSDPHECGEPMSTFEHIFGESQEDPILAAKAVQMWSLLYSTFPVLKLDNGILTKSLPMVAKLLDHKALEVRLAAGECIGLLYGSFQAREHESEEEKKAAHHEHEEENIRKPGFALQFDSVIPRLEALATESSKHQARRDKVRQKSLFREVVETIEDGSEPSEKVTSGKQRVHVKGWAKVLQLEHLRAVLGGGFQLHLLHNRLLKEILEIDGDDSAGTEPSEESKRMDKLQRHEKEKMTSQAREKQRRLKSAFINEPIPE